MDFAGTLLYFLTLGILIAFFGLILSAIKGRKDILEGLKGFKITKRELALVLIIALVFFFVEHFIVQPTQLLYFDDDIYQAMAQSLLHTGQAWMCNYGTPTSCYSGQLFLEPIGESFNIAIGFLIFGVSRNITYATQVTISFIAVIFTFFTALLLFDDKRAAYFSELLVALSPTLLLWARPTTSDLPLFAYGAIAVFFFLLFMRRKNRNTFAMFAFALALACYMKVNAEILVLVFLFGYFILDYNKNILKQSYSLAKKALCNNYVIIIILLFTVSLVPELIYSNSQFSQGSYVYQGSVIPNSCSPSSPGITASTLLNFANFEFNFCANAAFWLDSFKTQYVIQPFFYTILAIIGALSMFFAKRKEFAFLAVWFAAFFVIYTAFYAGSVVFGINWRFMLSLILQASLFAGFGCMMLIDYLDIGFKKVSKSKVYKKNSKALRNVATVILVLLIFYALFLLIPLLNVSPTSLPQAADARFYENFVLNESSAIPNNCIVYTYDPTLFFLVNRSALQMSYLYNKTAVANVTNRYSCQVVDYGYWCYTPKNFCPKLNGNLNLTPIVKANYTPLDKTFGFYRIQNTTNS